MMKKRFLILILFATISNAQQLAFPSAKGAGAYTTGGRGGNVIHVTTLDWDASGGLKEAIQTPGPRTIVFDVSGEIDATQEGAYYSIITGSQYDHLTIAGQTAPHGGITIKTSEFMFTDVDQVIIRYIRFRGTGAPLPGKHLRDAVAFLGGTNIIMDHVTFSHGVDEAASFANSSGTIGEVTIQNCLFQNSKTGSILGIGGSGGDFTFINNVYSNISHRFPNPKGDGRYDIINNIVYNWKRRLVRVGDGQTSANVNVLNNYYKPSSNGLRDNSWYGNGSLIPVAHKLQITSTNSNPLIHTAGNIIEGQFDIPRTDDRDMWQIFDGSYITTGSVVPDQYFSNIQFPLVGQTFLLKTASEAFTDLVVNKNVGANKTLNADGSINSYLDTKDAADMDMIVNDTYNGSFYDGYTSIAYPIIPQNTRALSYDTDNDGMPDVYEDAMSLNKNNPLDGKIITATGHTNLETYLNNIDGDYTPPPAIDVTGVNVTPSGLSIEIGNTTTLSHSILPTNATNQTGNWGSSNGTVATVNQAGLITALSKGQTTIAFTTNDGAFTDTCIVTVIDPVTVNGGKMSRKNKIILISN